MPKVFNSSVYYIKTLMGVARSGLEACRLLKMCDLMECYSSVSIKCIYVYVGMLSKYNGCIGAKELARFGWNFE